MTEPMNSIKKANRETVIENLQEVLSRDNSLSRCCAVRALEKMKAIDKESINKLIDALHDSDPDVSMDAAQALGNLNMEDAVDPLIDTLKNDPDGEVRIQAVIALGKMRSKKALNVLMECIKEDGYLDIYDGEGDDMEFAPAWEVQSQALDALGELGDENAADGVIELLLNEEYEDLQEKGFRVLAKLSSTRATNFLLEQLEKGGRLARRRAAKAFIELDFITNENGEIDNRLLESLSNALLDEDPDVRIYAARALGATKSPQIIVPLTMLLSDNNSNVCEEAAEILGKMRGKAVAEKLIKLMSDSPSPYLITKVLKILGEIGSPEYVDLISMYLSVDDRDLNYAAVLALGKIAKEGPEEKIASMLDDEKMDNNVRVQAAIALGRMLKGKGMESREVDETVGEEELLDASDEEGEAVESVEEVIDPVEVLKRTVFDKKDNVSIASMTALAEIDPEGSVETLADILLEGFVTETVDQCEVSHISEDMNSIEEESEEDKPSVEELLGDGEVAIGKEDVSTLASIMASQVSPEAQENREIKRKLEEEARSFEMEQREIRVKLIAARLLGERKCEKALETLTEAVDIDNPDICKEVITSLGRIGDEKSLPLVLEGLESDSRDVRLASIDALKGFGAQSVIEEKLHILIGDPDYFVRERALNVAASMEGSTAVDLLSRALDDEEMVVKRAALNVVTEDEEEGELSGKVLNVIFDHGGELRREAARTLRRLEDPHCTQILLDRLNDADYEEYHWMCIDALAEFYSALSGTLH